MWLIVGLGNPGSKYLLTRHNSGFMALDYLVKSIGVQNSDGKQEHKAQTIDFKWEDQPIKLIKPLTYMNKSGESVGEIMRYYKVPLENIIVVYDDLDTPYGQIRLKQKAGDGGHNGIKSLIEQLGTNEFLRVRIGIGRPTHPDMDPADYVLQNFSKQELTTLPDHLNTALDAIEMVVFEGPLKAMNTFNTKPKEEGNKNGL
ncbi:MAG: aminoacyl-tRNA hydrolase [Oligoflexia bacterium]|nr:aminoacyl-tRNA hydrolase [Oligoflexia bacterium]